MIALNLAILLLRITVGTIFVSHGMQKLFGYFGGPGIQGVTEMMKNMGMSPPLFWAVSISLFEFLGGLMVLLGIFPRIGAVLIIIVMSNAILRVHLQKGFFNSQGGYEFNLLIITVCLAIILIGAGRYSIFNKF